MSNITTKRVTVIEREYNDKGDLVKETETITEYENSTHTSPWTQPRPMWDPLGPVISH